MNKAPVFLTREVIVNLHADSLALFGGSQGSGEGLIESALGSAQNAWFYDCGNLLDQ